MEELIEHLYERDDHVYNDDDHNSLFVDNNQPMFTEPMDSSDSSAIPQDPYGLTTTTSTHDNKRSRDQAEFSSPEESPAYKNSWKNTNENVNLAKSLVTSTTTFVNNMSNFKILSMTSSRTRLIVLYEYTTNNQYTETFR